MVSPGFFAFFFANFRVTFCRINYFWKSVKSVKNLLIFMKKCYIIGVSGEKCIKVERCGEFPHFPHSFPQPGGAAVFTHQNDNE